MTNIQWAYHETLGNDELNELFRAAWPGFTSVDFTPILATSLTWVTARKDGTLAGFINVAWDGFNHAFLIDRTALPEDREAIRHGLVVEAMKAVAESSPTVGKVHLECDDDEVGAFADELGFAQVPAGRMPVPRS